MGRRILLACIVALSTIRTVDADETHYQTFLIGERALGMGGAATGVADETSAVFYNPAGIALLGTDALGGNLSINAFDRREIERGYGSPIGVSDLNATSRPGVPVFASAVKRFGKRDEDGVRPHAFALSTINPIQRRLRFEVELFNPTTGVRESLEVEHERRVTYYGPSLAFRLRDDLAIGLSAFWVRTRMTHREDSSIVTDIAFDPVTGTFQNETVFLRESYARLRTDHFLFRLGAVYQPTSKWRIGLMFQPPGIEWRDRARVRNRIILADTLSDPAYATLEFVDARGLNGAAPIPWSLRVGASYAPSDSLLFAADFQLVGRVGTAGNPVRAIQQPDPVPETGYVAQVGDYYPEATHRLPTFNIAVGMEAVIADTVPVRLGFFTDRSAAPSINGPTAEYRHVDIDRYGATFSIGFRDEAYDLSVGVAALFGRGDALRTNPDFDPQYLPTDASDRVIYFFISGARRAASRFAKQIVRSARSRDDVDPEERETDGMRERPDSGTDTDPDPDPDSESDSDPDPDPDSESDSESDPEPEPDAEAETDPPSAELPGDAEAPAPEPLEPAGE